MQVAIAVGQKVNLVRQTRSATTGALLPRQGTLVYRTENLGRVLLLIAFENGHREYLFEHEIELENGTALEYCGVED